MQSNKVAQKVTRKPTAAAVAAEKESASLAAITNAAKLILKAVDTLTKKQTHKRSPSPTKTRRTASRSRSPDRKHSPSRSQSPSSTPPLAQRSKPDPVSKAVTAVAKASGAGEKESESETDSDSGTDDDDHGDDFDPGYAGVFTLEPLYDNEKKDPVLAKAYAAFDKANGELASVIAVLVAYDCDAAKDFGLGAATAVAHTVALQSFYVAYLDMERATDSKFKFDIGWFLCEILDRLSEGPIKKRIADGLFYPSMRVIPCYEEQSKKIDEKAAGAGDHKELAAHALLLAKYVASVVGDMHVKAKDKTAPFDGLIALQCAVKLKRFGIYFDKLCKFHGGDMRKVDMGKLLAQIISIVKAEINSEKGMIWAIA